MEINELEDQLHRLLLQVAAGISTELSDNLNQFQKLEIKVENRQAHIELEKGNITVEDTTLLNRLYDEVEKEARKRRPSNPQKAVDEEIAALNKTQELLDSEEEEKETGTGSGSLVKDKVINS